MRLFSCTGGLQPAGNVANYTVCNAHHLASQLACSPRSCLAKLQFFSCLLLACVCFFSVNSVKCLTFFILPQALNTDDVRLQVGLRRLHVDELPDVVRVVFVAAVLLVVSLRLHVLRQAFGFLAIFRQQNKEINLTSQTPEPVRHIVGKKKTHICRPSPPPSFACPPRSPWGSSPSSPAPRRC